MLKVNFKKPLFVIALETRLKCFKALAFLGRLWRRFAWIVSLYSIWATSFAFDSKKWVSPSSKTFLHLEA
jgi:hypothetical protein